MTRRLCLMEALERLIAGCRDDNWDGAGAKAARPGSAAYARWFLSKLPEDITTPEVGITPEGIVSFDWIDAPSRMICVLFISNGDLAYTVLEEGNVAKGRFSEPTKWPEKILSFLRHMK